MYCTKRITDDLTWVGANDRRLAMFEGVYPVPSGVSYNSYLLMDESTVLFDTVDKSVGKAFFENVEHTLAGRDLDYLIVSHMEPDHSATMSELFHKYPNMTIVCSKMTADMIESFFGQNIEERAYIIKEGDYLYTGRHKLMFIAAPMVHWPEVMVTYDTADKILFSADAFGTFGALNGAMFSDEVDFFRDYLDEARRYYTNIVGKYGDQVQALLKKAASLEINMICPLHGFVWRARLNEIIDKYLMWSSYTPEESGVVIAYASVYGNTENAADILAVKLREHGIKVAMFDVSVTHPSEIVAAAFRYSHLVFASTTYNAGVFVTMETILHDIAAHGLRGRTIGFIQNGSWAATSGKLMRNILSQLKNTTFIDDVISIKSSLKSNQMDEIDALALRIADSMKRSEHTADAENNTKIENAAFFKLSYGLYILTVRDGDFDNGCVVNTVVQLTDTPKRITVAVNTANYTEELMRRTGLFTVSVLTEETPFKLLSDFGFQSGRDVNKFAHCENITRTANGIAYIPQYTNACLSCKIISAENYGTHTLFTAEVVEARILDENTASLTYQYYFDHIKPKPAPVQEDKKGFVCKICGYVYEGDTLPEDFICPLCKHGAADFEPLK